MKKTVFRIVSVLILLTGILLLLEGGFHVSTATKEGADRLLPDRTWVIPYIQEAEKEDVMVQVYRDMDAGDAYYILEFSKNTLWDLYALTDSFYVKEPDEPIYSVVSSALHSYAYCVDIDGESVEIFEGQRSQSLPLTAEILALGIVSCLAAFWKKDPKKQP